MGVKIIITGSTGMVGEGVLLECLEHPAIEQVLMVNRKPSPINHPKVKECIVKDFFHLEEVLDHLRGYDACFYCAGISSRGMSEQDYTYITYDTTLHFANTLLSLNPDRSLIIYREAIQTALKRAVSCGHALKEKQKMP